MLEFPFQFSIFSRDLHVTSPNSILKHKYTPNGLNYPAFV